MARLFLLLGAAVVVLLVFFPDEVQRGLLQAKEVIERMAMAAAGYYGAR